jgi:hypothetical protein
MRKYLIGIFFLLLPLVSHSQDYDLLLAISYRQQIDKNDNLYFVPSEKTKYSSLWISSLNDSLKVVADISEIIIPIDTAYYRMGIKRSYYNNWAEDLIWFCPIDDNPKLGIDAFWGESCSGSESYYLYSIGDNFLSMSQHGYSYCNGSNPAGWSENSLVPINNLINGEFSSASLNNIVDSTFMASLVAEGELQKQDLEEDELWYLEDTPSSAGIYHENGRFYMTAMFGPSNSYAQGYSYSFTVTSPLPDTLIGENVDTTTWKEVQSQLPDATDMVMSPDKKYSVITSSNLVYLCKVLNNQIVLPAYNTYPINGDDVDIKMFKWYSGKEKIRHFERFKVFDYEFLPQALR